jgi:hypothetical protein
MSAPSRPRLSRTTWVTVALLVVLTGFYVAVLSAAEVYYRPAAAAMSTYGTEPTGMAALFRYLAATGAAPGQLTQFDPLPAPRGSVIVVAGPLVRQPSDGDTARLRDWVSAGGTLIIAAQEENALHGIAGIKPVPTGRSGRRYETRVQATMLTAGVRSVRVDAARMLETLPDDAVPELGDPSAPVMASRRVGRGMAVVLADEYALSNQGLPAADDLALALDLSGAGGAYQSPVRVLFDEYHHGYASGGGAWEKLPAGVRLSVIELMLAAVLMVAAAGRRLGTPRPFVALARTSPMEYVRSLAVLLGKAGASRRAGEVLVRSLERDISGRLGTAARDRDAFGRALAARGWTAAASAVELAQAPTEDEGELLAVARAVADARREVAGAGRRDRGARRVPQR